MDFLESLSMASRTLLANKLRSSLTMLGIIIGNASVIIMVGVGQGAQKLASEQFEALGPNVLFVVPGSRETQNTSLDFPRTLVLADAEAIAAQVPSVAAVAPQRQNQQFITYRNKNLQTLVVGTTPEFMAVRSFELDRGRFIADLDVKRNNQVVAIGSDIADRVFGPTNPIGESLRVKGVSFQVVGVMKRKGAFMGVNQDDAVYVPITTMVNRVTGRTSPYGLDLTFISISAVNEASVPAAQFQITNLLRLRHQITTEDDFTVESQKDILQIVGAITGALTIMLAAIAGISLVVGGIGIMNIMLVSVTERTQEIGLRKAIGASEQDILIQFMIEAVILSVAGGLVGTSIGVGGILLVGTFTPLNAGISWSAIALATGVSGAIGLFFGVLPAQRAAQLDPIVALRTA
jgi:putative ABC transport system permease protein